MKKRSPSRRSSARAQKRGIRSPKPSDEAVSDATDSARRGAWDPDRTDIERPNEGQCPSIETAPRHAEAGGVEAPEPLSEEKKAFPFE
ncbi:hypothetical protein H4CHR_03880 [Variovorax sp. PBS-H4]|uniref:hypothetical protein n=1 Tax=Variovorax sp. PBS-H4 TaxID=434008 RepID=UPI0013187825|nr:hypothetical protein [Variovorax sp. PBS-H4]VTU36305.1 hypothetical protein H4CHR_03880 [Variovorax sp. PBS-H4]